MFLPSKVDNNTDHIDIANNFADKYKTILDQKGNTISSAVHCDLDLKEVKTGTIN